VLMVRICYAGDVRRGEQVVAPLRLAADPLADLVGPMPYPALFDLPARSHGAVIAVRSMFLDRVDTATAGRVVEHLGRGTAPLRMVQLRALGGAISRVDDSATAFAHRQRRFLAVIASNDEPDLDTAHRWTEGLANELPHVDQGGYIGFFGPHDGDRIVHAYPPATLDRLRRIKATYDPANLFRHNDNIAPAGDRIA
jgi:hypothetical protein